MGSTPPNVWGLVLAGGDGIRLRELTRAIVGTPIPKQYCRIVGDRSPLEATLTRITPIVRDRRRIILVLNRDHLPLAGEQIRMLARENLVIQPSRRDTGPAVLYGLLRLALRDPGATVVVFPSTQHVRDEAAFRSHVERAVRIVGQLPQKIALLGIEPDRYDPDASYIERGEALPVQRGGQVYQVTGLSGPATPEVACLAVERRALWNSRVTVFGVARVLELLRKTRPADVVRVQALLECSAATPDRYAALPSWNFWGDFLGCVLPHVVALPVSGVGWSDWRTPAAVERTLAELGRTARSDAAA